MLRPLAIQNFGIRRVHSFIFAIYLVLSSFISIRTNTPKVHRHLTHEIRQNDSTLHIPFLSHRRTTYSFPVWQTYSFPLLRSVCSRLSFVLTPHRQGSRVRAPWANYIQFHSAPLIPFLLHIQFSFTHLFLRSSVPMSPSSTYVFPLKQVGE